jgi:DNA-directed RNA polymerase specialized sigma24 family protein
MKFLKRNHNAKEQESPYATSDDFRKIFTEYKDDLHMFSFLLTGNHEAAEQCFVAGLEESVRAEGVFREWSRSWAKRTIIQNAIRALRPCMPVEAPSLLTSVIPDHGKLPEIFDERTDVGSVLSLEDFERIIFVMSVLEGYSDRRCALLLNCTDQEVRTARAQAIVRITKSNAASAISEA